jgi:hypothetical protein
LDGDTGTSSTLQYAAAALECGSHDGVSSVGGSTFPASTHRLWAPKFLFVKAMLDMVSVGDDINRVLAD